MLLGQNFALSQTTVLKNYSSHLLLLPLATPMHQRDPSYSYDDQGATYTGHTSHPSGEYIPTDYQPYDGSNHYYAAPSHAAPSHTTGGVISP